MCMEHRGARYEIKKGIERNRWVWIVGHARRRRFGSRGARSDGVSYSNPMVLWAKKELGLEFMRRDW